jgi:hypothetical protein
MKHHAMKWGGVIAPSFVTSALDANELSASRPSRFTLGEGTPGTYYMGGWVGPRAGLNAVE